MPPRLTLRSLEPPDVDGVVELSLRAWAPVFASLRAVLGDAVFLRLHPDWAAGQAEAVRSVCLSTEREVLVALDGAGTLIGFVAVWLHAYHEGMGAIDMIAVDPAEQGQGFGRELTEQAVALLRSKGMHIAVVETGGDPGHAPARRTYESSGFTLLPIARYFRLLDS